MRTVVKLRRHNILVLLGAALVATFSIFSLHGVPGVQFLILAILILFYLVWAFVFHYIDKSLQLEVVLEYILTAMLALVILYGVLL